MSAVTPPQDAKFKIDLKDLLRPYHTYANDVLPLAGMYFLKRYTKTFRYKAGNKVEEENSSTRLGAVFLPQHGGWWYPSHGPPSITVVRGVPSLPPNSDLLFFRIRVVVAQMASNDGKLCWGECINTTGNRVCEPQGQINREGSEFETSTYAHLVNLDFGT